MLCSAALESTTSKLASSNGSLRASAVCTSTRSATPSIIALLHVAAGSLPLRSSACHMSMPVARPVVNRLADQEQPAPASHVQHALVAAPFEQIEIHFALAHLAELARADHPARHRAARQARRDQ